MSSAMEFVHAAGRLKTELRRAYKSNGSRETVAEHSWRLSLMTMTLSGTVEGVDRDKCIKMAIVHDLPEVYSGDVYRLDLERQVGRHDIEKDALERLTGLVTRAVSRELTSLWLEFEEGITKEARMVRLIDRLEVLVQHNESDVSKWSETEKQIQYGLAEKHAEKFGFLLEFAREIDRETKRKLTEAGYRPRKVGQRTYDKYYG